MRVLQINSVCGIGSTGRIVVEIHNLLESDVNNESYIAYGRNEARDCKQAIKIGTKLDNYIHVLNSRLFDKHGFGSTKATEIFINQIKEINPDIIHLHNIHGYYINIEVLFNYLKNIDKPVVWTLHDCWAFTGHCAYFDFVECDQWKTTCLKCPQLKSYPETFTKGNVKENYINKQRIFTGHPNLTIVTPSKWLKTLTKQSFLREYNVEVINNGIDLEKFQPRESTFRRMYKIEEKFLILGVASVWDERKGLKFFLELSNMLEKDEVIILIGLNKKQLEDLPDNIIGISRTNNEQELAELYSGVDIFVNPTLEDNFPTTNLESLACGTPVITFDTGGSVESIDIQTGSITKTKDAKGILDEIRIIRGNHKSAYTNFCRQRALNLYNSKDKFLEYIELYRKLIQGG